MSKQETIGYPVLNDQIILNLPPINHPSDHQQKSEERPLDFRSQFHPVLVTCPHCKNQGVTIVTSKIGLITWLTWYAWCLMGFWCCCCIPCYISELREASHSCQYCGSYLGSSQVN